MGHRAIRRRHRHRHPDTTRGADLRSFILDDDAILHQVVTANTFVILRSDWAAGQIESARTLGTISVDTVTGTVPTPDR